jgi:PAS domain S-box-containing protein
MRRIREAVMALLCCAFDQLAQEEGPGRTSPGGGLSFDCASRPTFSLAPKVVLRQRRRTALRVSYTARHAAFVVRNPRQSRVRNVRGMLLSAVVGLLGSWRDVSIAKKLYFAVGIMALLIVGELATLRFAMHTLSAARAFVGGEGLWSKSQKNAAIDLQRYGRTKDEADFRSFLADMDVPEGDRQARLELFKSSPSLEVVRAGFLRGRIHADDIDPMIDLLQRFYWTSYLSRAITVWSEADRQLIELKAAGLDYHAVVVADDDVAAAAKLAEIKRLNEGLTVLEDEFSYILGAGSRWLEQVVLTLLSIAVLAVESIGLTLTFLTSRSISRGLNELNMTATHIGRGEFERTIAPRSLDEIGQLARSVNQMGQMLRRSYTELEVRVKERTSALARSRDQLDVILKGITDGISVLDDLGRFVFVNEAGAKMVGASVDELLQRPQNLLLETLEIMDEHGAPFPVEKLPSRLALAGVANPAEVVLRVRPASGSEERWTIVKSTPVVDEEGRPQLVVTIFKDITARKRAEDAVKFLDEASQILASSTSQGTTLRPIAELSVPRLADVCAVDLLADERPAESFAICRADLAGLALSEGGGPWPVALRVLGSARPELLGDIDDDWLAHVGWEERPLADLRARGVRSAMVVPLLIQGKVFGALTFVAAGSRRRYTSADLLVAEELARRAGIAIESATLYELAQKAIRVRNEFLSIASHEFNTPLTVLTLQLHLAKQKMDAVTNLPSSLDSIATALDASGRQVRRLTRLVEHLLDVSRIEAGKMTFTFERRDLSDIVREVVSRFSNQFITAGIDLDVDIQGGVVGWVDQMRVEQIIDNLLTNAIKYAPGAPLSVSVASANQVATLTIEDHGPGIAEDKQTVIFDRFERVTPSRLVGGLGLGLYIVKEIVSGYGGKIALTSQEGQGARFTVELPLSRAALDHPESGTIQVASRAERSRG